MWAIKLIIMPQEKAYKASIFNDILQSIIHDTNISAEKIPTKV